MKLRMIIAVAIIIIFFESCARTFTPYEAANSPEEENVVSSGSLDFTG